MHAFVENRLEFEGLLRHCTNYENLPAFHAGRVRTDLGRIQVYAERLGHPELAVPVVHVTGTKGKGSTSMQVARLLSRLFGPTGLHSSPHLTRMEERVALDGEPIGEAALFQATNQIIAARGAGADPGFPTFFEFITLVAMLEFRRAGMHAAVHEVGLGGRLDATNIVSPVVAICTNLSLEHTAVLGQTIEEIAREKAGIVKPGVLLITGVRPGAPGFAVLEQAAREAQAPLLALDRDLAVERFRRTESGGMEVDLRVRERRYAGLRTRFCGLHQAENLALALAAAEVLIPEPDPEKVAESLADLSLPGRLERISEHPTVLLDGAHTKESVVLALNEALALEPARVVVLFDMAMDKDCDAAALALAQADHVVTTRYDSLRASDPSDLAVLVRKHGGRAEVLLDPESGLRRACQLADRAGLVLVVGSLYLAGLVRSHMLTTGDPGGPTPWNM